MIDTYLALIRILENTNLQEYELTDMPMEQPDELAHNGSHFRYNKYVGVGTMKRGVQMYRYLGQFAPTLALTKTIITHATIS